MNDLSIVFENNPVRNVFQDGEWWFCAKDVCAVLEIRNPRDTVSRLEENQLLSVQTDTSAGPRQMTFISEDGLYDVILKSNKPEAKKFKAYVLGLVKAHRKGEVLTLEQVNAALEQQKAELNAENLKLIEIANVQHETINAMDGMFDPAGCQDMGSAVKILREYFCDEGSTLVGRNKLFAFLRDTKVLMHNNMPYQAYAKHFVHNKITGTTFLKNSSIGWLKRFVHKRVPKKASVLQIAHTRKMFDLNIVE